MGTHAHDLNPVPIKWVWGPLICSLDMDTRDHPTSRTIMLLENGEPILMGRSSVSCHHQLSASRMISRVHVARSRAAEKDRGREGREAATPGGGGEEDMIWVDEVGTGEPILMGRSSVSCHHQLSASRMISRVHVKATYKRAPNPFDRDRVEIALTWTREIIRLAESW
jgi:hypothetical protein